MRAVRGSLVLGPVIVPPPLDALGRVTAVLSGRGRSTVELARSNAVRNPRGAATTSAALLIGVTVVTGFVTVSESPRASVDAILDRQVPADFVVNANTDAGVPPGVIDDVNDLANTGVTVPVYRTSARGGGLQGRDVYGFDLSVYDELAQVAGDGSLADVAAGDAALDHQTASVLGKSVGDTVDVDGRSIRVGYVAESLALFSGVAVSACCGPLAWLGACLAIAALLGLVAAVAPAQRAARLVSCDGLGRRVIRRGRIAFMTRWIDTLRERAAANLPAPVFEYFAQGSGNGRTAAEATRAWDRLRLRPRVLHDVSSLTTATTVLGREVAAPILAAPSTLQLQADPGGEPAVVRALNDAGGLACVSSNSGTLFGEIGTQGEPWWVQAYVMRDRSASLELLRPACAAGASAVVLTADTPVVASKVNAGPTVWSVVPAEQIRANVDAHGLPDSALEKADDLTPDDIGWLRDELGVPVVVKGVLRADDAKVCADAGAAAVWVSNHGGRQLDQALSTAEALPDVAEALGDTDVETYVDGGLNCGVHVLAALALGARAVFLGRLTLWALTAGGEEGVRRLYTDMAAELREAMTLAGAANVDEITLDLISSATG